MEMEMLYKREEKINDNSYLTEMHYTIKTEFLVATYHIDKMLSLVAGPLYESSHFQNLACMNRYLLYDLLYTV